MGVTLGAFITIGLVLTTAQTR